MVHVGLDDGVIRLPGRITKTGKPRSLPIFKGDMMNGLREEQARHDKFYPESPWVFSRAGDRVKSFKAEWEMATAAAGIPDLRFHDLRRTAVRNMVRIHGLDRDVVKKISGHLTDVMFSRYNITDEQDIKAAKRKVDSAANGVNSIMSEDLLATLGAVPEEKLRALLALLKPS